MLFDGSDQSVNQEDAVKTQISEALRFTRLIEDDLFFWTTDEW